MHSERTEMRRTLDIGSQNQEKMPVQLKVLTHRERQRERKGGGEREEREREGAKEEILSCDKSQCDIGDDRLVEGRISDGL